MSTRKWRLSKDEENALFYAQCRELHEQARGLIKKLGYLLRELKNLKMQKEKQTSSNKVEKDDVDVQGLQSATEKMEKVTALFQSLSYRKQPSEMPIQQPNKKNPVKDHNSPPVSHSGSTDTNTSNSSSSKKKPPPPPSPPKVSRAVFTYKASFWKDKLKVDQITLAYLTQQIVSGTLAHCCEVAQQNHGQRTLANMFRLAKLYNELLSLTLSEEIGIATSCRNTCPTLLHPLRKLSVTKILQILAQHRAEQSCHSIIFTLINSYHSHDQLSTGMTEEGTSPEMSENSSLEVYRALAKHITPPTTVLPPVEKSSIQQVLVLPGSDMSPMGRLLEIEEEHVATLLAVAAFSVPEMLGNRSIRSSRSTGLPKVSKQMQTKAVEYYQQVLWDEVGTFSEHMALWWEPCSLATYPIENSQQFRAWLHKIQLSGSVPQPIVPAIQSLMDGLCCHITATLWDQHFRKTLIRGTRNVFTVIYHSNQQPKGTETGHMFAEMLKGLVSLSNECESTVEWLSGAPLEDLPLVEQIPVLHRLDHSVHTTRLWALASACRLASVWNVAKFFLVSQADIKLCLQELQQLHLATHQKQSSATSEHVTVCAKMRSKLVSEVLSNIEKLKKVPEECISRMASVCRTISLANLHMCFPDAKYWRQSRPVPKVASSYVEVYLEQVLQPVLRSISPLPMSTQQTVGGMVMRILCDAWLDHIYIHRIKFSEWGAVQLLMDFGAISNWLEQQKEIPLDLQHFLMKHEVLRRCEGVGRLLLRHPGEPIPMVEQTTRSRQVPESPSGSHSSQLVDMLPAEMYVPNQEQWLELRAPRSKGLSLCCSS